MTGIAVAGAAFRVTGTPALPATVPAGQTLRFSIVFAPTQPGTFTGSFRIDVSGSSVSGTLTGSTAAPDITLSYVEPDTNNILPLRDGATLPFPNTAMGTGNTITFVIANAGAGTGTVSSIAINGSAPAAFQLLNLPALPVTVAPSQQLRFGVRFVPPLQQAFSASLLLNVNGQTLNVNLQALATAPQFTYAYGAAATAVSGGGTLTLPDTTVGQTSSVAVTIKNAGSADGQVPAITVSGQGFSLSDLPTVPFTLHPNDSQQFTLNFAPLSPER